MEPTTKLHLFEGYISRTDYGPALIKYWCPYCERLHQHGYTDGDRDLASRVSHCLEHSPVAHKSIEIAISNKAEAAQHTESNPTPLLDRKKCRPPRFYANIRVHGAAIREAVLKATLSRTKPHQKKGNWGHWSAGDYRMLAVKGSGAGKLSMGTLPAFASRIFGVSQHIVARQIFEAATGVQLKPKQAIELEELLQKMLP